MSKLDDKKIIDDADEVIDPDQQSFDLGDDNPLLDEVKTDQTKKLSRDKLFAPKVVLGSSLFTTRNKNQERTFIKRETLFVAPNVGTITYTGQELRSYDDKKVWQLLLKTAREKQIHKTEFILTTTIYYQLIQLGWGTGKKAYERYKECLERLKGGALTTTSSSGNKIRSASLIGDYEILEADSSRKASLIISISKKIYQMFANVSDVVFLSQSKTSPLTVLADKVYDIIQSSHGADLRVSDYMDISGSNYKLLRQFRARFKKALDELQARGLIASYKINKEDIVSVETTYIIP